MRTVHTEGCRPSLLRWCVRPGTKRSIGSCGTTTARCPMYSLQHRLHGPQAIERRTSIYCVGTRAALMPGWGWCEAGRSVQADQHTQPIVHHSQHEARVLDVLLDAHKEGNCLASIEESTHSPGTGLSIALGAIHSCSRTRLTCGRKSRQRP